MARSDLRSSLRPGEREWRIVNACPSRYLRLTLDGQDVKLLRHDLGRLPKPEDITDVVIAPGNRVELLVDVPEGSSTLITAPVDHGCIGGMMGGPGMGDEAAEGNDPIKLLALKVSRAPTQGLPEVPAGPALRGLREEPIAFVEPWTSGWGRAGRHDRQRGRRHDVVHHQRQIIRRWANAYPS